MVRIPTEYQEVEYLESDGSSYINSEIIPSVSDVYTFRGEFRNIENSVLFGCRSSGTYQNSNHLYLNRNGNGGSGGTGIVLLVTNTARAASSDFDKNVFFATGNNLPLEINESDVSIEGRTSLSFAPTQPIYLLGFNVLGQNSESVGGGKLSYFKINGRCEFIPCYRKSDNKPGMYDTVTKQFFTNAGTGTFLVGNDVSWDTASLIERRRQILLNTPHLTTESANPLIFQTDISANLKDCKIYFEPVQDLHGYDKPYPAGGGVNAIPYAVAKTETVGGLTFSTDGKGTYTVTGTPTDIGYVYFDLIEPFTIPDGAVNKIHFFNNIAASQIQVAFINGTSVVDTWSINPAKRSANYSGMSNKPCTRIRIGCTNLNSTNPIDLTLKLMIVPNETVVTDYIPYENVCPITGWDGVTVYKNGANLFPLTLPSTAFKGTFGTGASSISSATYGRVWTMYVGENQNLYYQHGSISPTVMFAFSDKPLTTRTGAVIYNALQCASRNNVLLNSTTHPYLVIAIANSTMLTPETGELDAASAMLSFGNTRKSYEKRTDPSSITIPFPQTVYGGHVEIKDGEAKLVVDRQCKTRALSDSASSAIGEAVDGYFWDASKPFFDYGSTTASNYSNKISNILPYSYSGSSNVNPHFYASVGGQVYAYVPHGTDATTEIQICVPLATPIEYTLDPVTLTTLRGINNIWSDANGNIEVKFWKH